MTSYLYKCESCNNIFPVEFPFAQNKPLVYCEECSSPARRYVNNSVPFVYKTTGFVGKVGKRIPRSAGELDTYVS